MSPENCSLNASKITLCKDDGGELISFGPLVKLMEREEYGGGASGKRR